MRIAFSLRRSLALAVAAAALFGCATAGRFQSQQPGPDTAAVTVKFHITSARNVVLGGVFAEGRECRAFLVTAVDGRATPVYEMRVKPETLSLVFLSAGEMTGSVLGAGGFSGKRCGGTYSFDPKPGKQYVLDFFDEPTHCTASLTDISSGAPLNVSDRLVRREERGSVPGSSRCADDYKPR